ncbi:cation/H(+) antiporter 15-like [Senna tora]|uniref:Cation/H(+) antiporter 15-like n=1 Tax=Senna tora TaxID=362788 RepID=A0A834W4R4_9FABA|nr:cation/H(+) antiporter 15-like [Senna tora]
MEALANLKNAKRTWRFGIFPLFANFISISFLFTLPLFKLSQNYPPFLPLVLSVTTSVCAFPVISDNLLELNLITSELGQIALSASIVSEVVHWAYITISTVALSPTWMYFTTSYLAFLCFAIFLLRPAMYTIAKNTPAGGHVKRSYVVLIQIGVLAAGVLTDLLGLTFLQGPYLVGLVMPHGPPLATTIVDKTELIISHFLEPLYFCYIGLSVDVFAFQSWSRILKLQFVMFVGYVCRVLVSTLVALSYDLRPKHGVILGLMLNIKGFIEVFIFTQLRALKIIDDEMFTNLVFCVVETAAITSPLIETLYKPHKRLASINSKKDENTIIIRTIQNTQRNAELCVVSCVHKESEVRGMIAILEALNPTHANPIVAFVIHLIELRGQSTPMLRRVNLQNRKPWSINFHLNYPSTTKIARAFENIFHNSRHSDVVTVIPYLNIAPYKSMHHSVCNLAHDMSVPLIIVPFSPCDRSHHENHAASTVGILVDRHSRLGLASPAYSFQKEEEQCSEDEHDEDDDEERMMDDWMVEEFMAKKFGNGQVVYHEISVEGGTEKVFEMIKCLEGNYDLVMVGRKNKLEMLNDDVEGAFSNFFENAEMLGLFGDMLSSTEFCNGMVPVLVVHSGENKVKQQQRRVGNNQLYVKQSRVNSRGRWLS